MAKFNGKSHPGPKPVNLALQGGGSHGAFTWGVLDRLLSDGRIDFAAVSGTSAGAMNAVALADGWAKGGSDGARAKLHDFWRAVARKGRFSPMQRMPWEIMSGKWSVAESPSFVWFEAISRIISPYVVNPWNLNPLKDVLESEIDFGAVRACEDIQLFVSATNVETGKVRVFNTDEISLETVMASACLPHMFHAVEIDGIPHWDGGYGGNPVLFPFFYTNRVEDVLLIQINPILREGTPRTAQEISNRIDEITFNASLLGEFRAIGFVKKLIEAGHLDRAEYRDIRLHRINADEAFKGLTAASKMNAEWEFLKYLRDLGRAAAEDWLEASFDHVGNKATIDLADVLSIEMIAERGGMAGERVRKIMHADHST
jgi:NTE family protein